MPPIRSATLHDLIVLVLTMQHGHQAGALLRPIPWLAIGVAVAVVDGLVALEGWPALDFAQAQPGKPEALALAFAERTVNAWTFQVKH